MFSLLVFDCLSGEECRALCAVIVHVLGVEVEYDSQTGYAGTTDLFT